MRVLCFWYNREKRKGEIKIDTVQQMLDSAFESNMPCEIDGHGVSSLHKDPDQQGEYYLHIRCNGCGFQSILLACTDITHKLINAIRRDDPTVLGMCPDCDYEGTVLDFVASFTKKQAL